MLGAMDRSPLTWEIRVEGLLDSRWSEWFGDMAITYVNDMDTILIGELQDQPALYGVLERLRDQGMNLISVRRVDGAQRGRPVVSG